MTKELKYFSISSIEELARAGDGSKYLLDYSIADDENGSSNRIDKSIRVILTRGAEKKVPYDDWEKAVLKYIHKYIEAAILKKEELVSKITIYPTDKDFPPKYTELVIELKRWKEVVIEKRMGFLDL